MDIRHRGTFRTDYEADWARLDDFQVLTAEADKLLHRLIRASREIPYHNADGQEVILVSFLERHVLTVLADIARKKLSNYGNSFANVQGTAIQAAYTQKLRQDINRWIARLDSYLHNTWQAGNNSSPAAETARWLKDRLEQSLSADELDGNNNYYRMLRTVTAIQENVDYYLNQIKDSGDMNPALSLFIVYLKNYGSIAEAFNRRLATLPELYRKDILHAAPQDAVQDNVYVIITPQKVSEVLPCLRMSHSPLGKMPQEKNLFIGLKKKNISAPYSVWKRMHCTIFPILLMEELWNSINNLYNFKIQPMLKPCSHMVKNYA